jgi:hypothetical protein
MTNGDTMYTLSGPSQFPTTRWTLVVAAGDPHRGSGRITHHSETGDAHSANRFPRVRGGSPTLQVRRTMDVHSNLNAVTGFSGMHVAYSNAHGEQPLTAPLFNCEGISPRSVALRKNLHVIQLISLYLHLLMDGIPCCLRVRRKTSVAQVRAEHAQAHE